MACFGSSADDMEIETEESEKPEKKKTKVLRVLFQNNYGREFFVYGRSPIETAQLEIISILAESAIDFFNKENPHMPYDVLDVVYMTPTVANAYINYTMTITAKPRRLGNADVQTFEATVSYHPDEEPQVQHVAIVGLPISIW